MFGAQRPHLTKACHSTCSKHVTEGALVINSYLEKWASIFENGYVKNVNLKIFITFGPLHHKAAISLDVKGETQALEGDH